MIVEDFFINRKQVCEVFRQYVEQYDLSDSKIRLKVDHTFRVADLCEKIAIAQGLDARDTSIAWLIGMLHDIGRFEQVRLYNTFVDAESVDHAQLGADILFEKGYIRRYILDSKEDDLIEIAIRNHSNYRIQDNLNDKMRLFCYILRDADKIDIMRVNVETPLEEIYNTTTRELKQSTISEEVMKSFYEEHATLRELRKTPVDYVAAHISLVFELVFDCSVRIMHEQGYLHKLLFFASDNPYTIEQFNRLREYIKGYMKKRGIDEDDN